MKKFSQEKYLITEKDLYGNYRTYSIEDRSLSEDEVKSIVDDPDNLTDPRAVEDLPEDKREISAQDITNDPREAERVKEEYDDEEDSEEDSEDTDDEESEEDDEKDDSESSDEDEEDDSEEEDEDSDDSSEEEDEDGEPSQEDYEEFKDLTYRLSHGDKLSLEDCQDAFIKIVSMERKLKMKVASLESYNPQVVSYGELLSRSYNLQIKLKKKLRI